MKKLLVVVAAAAAMLLTSCATKLEEVKDVSNPIERVEHKGDAFGLDQPAWVGTVLTTTSQEALQKALGLEDKRIWVVYGDGPDLEYLRTWIDQVDARAEIAASIQQTIMDKVNAAYEGSKEGKSVEASSEVARISERAANVTVTGLVKEQDWWTKTRQLKVGLKKATSDSDYNYKYTYMVLYTMDMEMYKKQMDAAMDTVLDGVGTEMSAEIRQMLMDELYAKSGVTPRDPNAGSSYSFE